MRTIGIVLFMLGVGVAGCVEENTGGGDIGQNQQQDQHTDLASCGGFGGVQCPKGYSCVDDPNDSCDPEAGGADCSGVCMQDTSTQLCGGFANLPCPDGMTCVDNPNDDCDPNHGGADCGGICLKK